MPGTEERGCGSYHGSGVDVASHLLPLQTVSCRSKGPSAPPRHRDTHWFFIGHHPSFLDRRCPSKASSCSVWARSPALRPGDHWLTSSCTVRVHRSGSSSWSRSSIILLQKLRISGDMTRLIRRSSAASLADLTRSLSLDTGKPRSLVVPQIYGALFLTISLFRRGLRLLLVILCPRIGIPVPFGVESFSLFLWEVVSHAGVFLPPSTPCNSHFLVDPSRLTFPIRPVCDTTLVPRPCSDSDDIFVPKLFVRPPPGW